MKPDMLKDVKIDELETTDKRLSFDKDDEDCSTGSLPSSPQAMEEESGDSVSVFDQDRYRRLTAELVCKGTFPLRIVKGQGFREFVKYLQPQFVVPSEEEVLKDCMSIYVVEKMKLQEVLETLSGRISLSVDVWTAEDTTEFICLSAHFIDNDWKLQKQILNFFHASYELAGEELAEGILTCIQNWSIEKKISTITMGIPSANDAIAEILKDYFEKNSKLLIDKCFFQVHCCTYTLNEMVQQGLDEISETIGKALDLRGPGSLDLMTQNLIGWDRMYSSLKKSLELRGTFSQLDMEDMEIPSEDEWKKIEGLCAILQHIHNVVSELTRIKFRTANIYYHNLCNLRVCLDQHCMNPDIFISNLAKKLLQKLEKYLNDISLVLGISTVMDPRFKMKYVEFQSAKLGDGVSNALAHLVLKTIRRLYDEYLPKQEEFDSTSADTELENRRNDEKKIASEGDWLLEYNQFVASTTQVPKSELDYYLEEPVARWSHDFDALSWWKVGAYKYPTLSKVARDILAIPISAVPKKSTYYIKGTNLDRHLSCLEEDAMEALICMKSWFRRH